MTKVCKGCGVSKPHTAFSKESRTLDGLRARCRDCLSAQRAAWRAANQDHLKAYNKADAQRRREYQRAWRAANPDKIRAYRAQYDEQATRGDFLTQWRAAQG